MAQTLAAVFTLTVVAATSMALYLLPVIIGWARHVPDLGAIAVVDIALGWTLAGWVIALAMAMRSIPQPAPGIHVIQSISPASPAPGGETGQGAAPPWPDPSPES
jgi:hypothetical protein